MLIKTPAKSTLTENNVTDERIYSGRRSLLKKMGFLGASTLLSTTATSSNAEGFSFFSSDKQAVFKRRAIKYSSANGATKSEILTPEKKVISHNNFYEFGTKKSDPVNNAQAFKVNPWTLKISGEVNNPFTLDYDDLFNKYTIEEHIYRLRCVETWSMVIPWLGFSLSQIIKQADPTSKAKYVAFETLHDPEQMSGQRSRRLGGGIDYPYVEGLRMDEAMNPLTLMSVGLYGKTLPPQNGAPIRLIVPWKYGFKSIKSIVGIKLVDKIPLTTWNILAAKEYGFYANVNPEVDHPRWSQASERRITSGGLFSRNRTDTLPFNGYGEEVAHLYKNMDLRKHY